MKKLLAFLVLLAGSAAAQTTHTFPAQDTNNTFSGTNQFTLGHYDGPVTFANLPASPADGTEIYVSDGSATTPCTGGGTGALATRVNGVWNCATSGISGTPTAGSQLTGNGSAFVPQTKAVIDIRDTAGVDCTGTTDSGTALNTLFTSLSNKKLIWPISCTPWTSVKLTIQGQTSFIIEGQGQRPNSGTGSPSISGCGGSASDPVIYINRSSYGKISGLGIFAKKTGTCASNNFTQGIQVDNSGGGGFTPTQLIFENLGITSNIQGAAIANFIGINFSGSPNVEHMLVRESWFNCQHSTNSYGISVSGTNSDNDLAYGNSISGCFHGIHHVSGNMRIIQNHFGDNGTFSVFGANGAAIYIGGCVSGPMNILYNEESDGGPFINSNNDANGGCTEPINVVGNIMGISDISGSAYPLNLGTASIPYFVQGNDIYVFPGTTTKSAIGSSSQAACAFGPLGTLTDIGNYNHFPANTGGWTGCAGTTKDFQLGHFQAFSKADATAATAGLVKLIAGSGAGTFEIPQLRLPGSTSGTATLTPPAVAGTVTNAITSSNSITTPGQLISTIATGTAPLSVASTTNVANLNASSLSGATFAAPGAIGGGTPSTGAFTTLSATLNAHETLIGNGAVGAILSVAPGTAGQVYTSNGASADPSFKDAGVVPNPSTCPSNVYTVLSGDRVKYLTFNDASACAVTLPSAASFGSNFVFVTCNIGAGTVTITPTTSTISSTSGFAYTSAAASLALKTGQCAWIYSDNTDYFAIVRSSAPETYNHSGTVQAATHLVRDRCTLGTDCSVTLTGSAVFTSSSTYDCVASDRTSAAAVMFAPSSGSAFALTGTGTDTISYLCFGN